MPYNSGWYKQYLKKIQDAILPPLPEAPVEEDPTSPGTEAQRAQDMKCASNGAKIISVFQPFHVILSWPRSPASGERTMYNGTCVNCGQGYERRQPDKEWAVPEAKYNNALIMTTFSKRLRSWEKYDEYQRDRGEHLLRPMDHPVGDGSDTLMRPAKGPGENDEGHLLRPMEEKM